MNKTLLYVLVAIGIFLLSLAGSYVGSFLAVSSGNKPSYQQFQNQQMPNQNQGFQQNQFQQPQQSPSQSGSFGGQQQPRPNY